MEKYVGRLAPSPTGALHIGNARTFMIAWLRARSFGGRVIRRIEDLDHPRDKPGAASAIDEDLRWLGFDWDEEETQSTRTHLYRAALESLVSGGLAYPCVCSRADVKNAQSAPHIGEQLFYPGTCRDRFSTWDEAAKAIAPRLPAWRFRVPADTCVAFTDNFSGPFEQNVSASLGDFPLAREKYGAGYTLAATYDDCVSGVTEVVRGDDLIGATPGQILIARALGFSPPAYCHVPLVVSKDGLRLAKRHGDTRLASIRAAGVKPEVVLGLLAWWCGWAEWGEKLTLRELLPRFALNTIPTKPAVLTDEVKALLCVSD